MWTIKYLVPKQSTMSASLQCFSAGSNSLGGSASCKHINCEMDSSNSLQHCSQYFSNWLHTSQSKTVSFSFPRHLGWEHRRPVAFMPMVSTSKSRIYLMRDRNFIHVTKLLLKTVVRNSLLCITRLIKSDSIKHSTCLWWKATLSRNPLNQTTNLGIQIDESCMKVL